MLTLTMYMCTWQYFRLLVATKCAVYGSLKEKCVNGNCLRKPTLNSLTLSIRSLIFCTFRQSTSIWNGWLQVNFTCAAGNMYPICLTAYIHRPLNTIVCSTCAIYLIEWIRLFELRFVALTVKTKSFTLLYSNFKPFDTFEQKNRVLCCNVFDVCISVRNLGLRHATTHNNLRSICKMFSFGYCLIFLGFRMSWDQESYSLCF